MELFIARQPIFDKNVNVVGYEMLYRSGQNNYYDGLDPDQATSVVITNTFLLIGIQKLTRGKRAFINFTDKLLNQDVVSVLPKDLIAIEILENVEVTEELIESCRGLKQSGYQLVLDDFVFNPKYQPLIELADIIKVDFLSTPVAERRSLVHRIGSKHIKFLAEKIESREEFDQAVEMGYSLFQGYFFCKPVVLSSHEIPSSKLSFLQMLYEINRPEPDFGAIANIIKRDLSFSYKLLRLVNSAAYSVRRIDSIEHALVLLGMRELKKWITIILLSRIGKDKPDELLSTSLIRAKFAELIGSKNQFRERKSELFMMGLFSLIDVLLDRSMEEIMAGIPVSSDIKDALLGQESPFMDVYNMVLSYERGNWNEVARYAERLQLRREEVCKVYMDSLEWANSVFDLNKKSA